MRHVVKKSRPNINLLTNCARKRAHWLNKDFSSKTVAWIWMQDGCTTEYFLDLHWKYFSSQNENFFAIHGHCTFSWMLLRCCAFELDNIWEKREPPWHSHECTYLNASNVSFSSFSRYAEKQCVSRNCRHSIKMFHHQQQQQHSRCTWRRRREERERRPKLYTADILPRWT